MTLDLLPVEIIIQVFSHLGYRDLLTCGLVSRHPHHLALFNHTTIVPGVPSFRYSYTRERFLSIYNRAGCLWHAKWSSQRHGPRQSFDYAPEQPSCMAHPSMDCIERRSHVARLII